jgi:hypothetical protein
MNRSTFCFLLFSFFLSHLAAQVIECPADVTVTSAALDQDLDYGEATIFLTDPYVLEEIIHAEDFGCNTAFLAIYTKTFEVTANDGEVYTCDQLINVTRSEFSDFTFPEDITIEQANPYNLGTDLTGNISPESASEFNHTYSDQIIQVDVTIYKVLRTWTLLNWCSAEILEQIQIININDAQAINFSDNIMDVNGNLISWDLFTITDQDGTELDTDACANGIISIHELLNCIYENNNTAESIQLEITKEGDDLNGVSTLDLVQISRHILNIDPFENYAQVIAAQINDDANVSAIDLVEMRKLILGIYSEFPSIPSWVFYHNDIMTADESTDPSSYDLIFDAMEFPLDVFDILAIKKGDVNGSAIPD